MFNTVRDKSFNVVNLIVMMTKQKDNLVLFIKLDV